MTHSTLLEGCFAINKPPALSSAQVIRDAQSAFRDSHLFAPWIEREKQKLRDESHNQKNKRRSWKSQQRMEVKMGHGGTLDPMATGVLILGVGSGTRSLGQFLECTKSYETVVLFGAATDSYDAVGKLVARKDYSHITKQTVEGALDKFRGRIMQKPSIFSALKVNGKKMYEYAREGKELPVEIEARPVEVKELEMVDWMDGGTHDFHWPREEAPKQEKEVVDKALKLEEKGADTGASAKRKFEDDEEGTPGIEPSSKRPRATPEPEAVISRALPEHTATGASPALPQATRCPAPACRLRMTVTSGFYVRTLAHDLGEAVGSLGLMSSLIRTRQGDFELGHNVLDYEDLGRGEEVWGDKVEGMLKAWGEKEGREDGGKKGGGKRGGGRGGAKEYRGKKESEAKGRRSPKTKRRNSSSPDSDRGGRMDPVTAGIAMGIGDDDGF